MAAFLVSDRASFVFSAESMEIMARMGVGLMVIAQKPWETTEAELAHYRQRYFELNHAEAPKPLLVIVAGVSKDPAIIEKLREVPADVDAVIRRLLADAAPNADGQGDFPGPTG